MKDHPAYSIIFMFLIAAIASGILIGVDRATAERVQQNKYIQQCYAVLNAFKIADEQTADSEILQIFDSRVEIVYIKGAKQEFDVENILEFRLKAQDSDKIEGFAIPIYGRGFWDDIKGFLAIGADAKTVIGISFFQQAETPGLGAEIENPDWQAQFEKKVLSDGKKPLAIKSVGEELNESSVTAVTGATQTSVRVDKFMNEKINAWRTARSESESE